MATWGEAILDAYDSTTHSLRTGSASGTPNATPTSVGDGRKAVTTGGTAEKLTASVTAAKSVVVTAAFSNTGVAVVGGSTVVAASGTRRGVPLNPGESVIFDIDDISKLWVDVTVSGEAVVYAYTA